MTAVQKTIEQHTWFFGCPAGIFTFLDLRVDRQLAFPGKPRFLAEGEDDAATAEEEESRAISEWEAVSPVIFDEDEEDPDALVVPQERELQVGLSDRRNEVTTTATVVLSEPPPPQFNLAPNFQAGTTDSGAGTIMRKRRDLSIAKVVKKRCQLNKFIENLQMSDFPYFDDIESTKSRIEAIRFFSLSMGYKDMNL